MFLSIIIPVYNTENYLKSCLDSVLQQDIADYEIICVNDGSTDRSPEILEKYHKNRTNIRILHQKNAGVSAARNAGLAIAQGDYIWFVDSDDCIAPNCLGALEAASRGADRLVLGGGQADPDGDTVLWRNLLRRSFLQEKQLDFCYPRLHYGEDTVFLYELKRCLPVCRSFPRQVYTHRLRPDSLVYDASPEGVARRLDSMVLAAEIMKGYWDRQDGILTVDTADLMMKFLYLLLYRLARLPKKQSGPYLRQLRQRKFYPCRCPRECTLDRCPEITREDWVGKLYHRLYCGSHTRMGFCCLRLWLKLGSALRTHNHP